MAAIRDPCNSYMTLVINVIITLRVLSQQLKLSVVSMRRLEL